MGKNRSYLDFIKLIYFRARLGRRRLCTVVPTVITPVFVVATFATAVGFSLGGCTGASNLNLATANATASPTPSPTASAAPGVRAVKIIFQKAAGGSFDTPPAGGTPPVPGSGLQAIRLFNADGTVLASSGSSGSGWPAWLAGFEIGISGGVNTAAKNPACANFASSSEGTNLSCDFGGGAASSPCGAPPGQFRVSEVDCSVGAPAASNGNGGGSDGVYIRASFNRSTSALGANENILAVLEYASSALNPAPSNPTACFTGGGFSAEACSDFVWRTYLKHSTTELVQPYLMLVPPMFSSVLVTNIPSPLVGPQASGTGLATKQIFLPLAGDSGLTVFQISRTQSNFPNPNTLKTYCAPNGNLPGNSPLCAGMVFYSLTLYRI